MTGFFDFVRLLRGTVNERDEDVSPLFPERRPPAALEADTDSCSTDHRSSDHLLLPWYVVWSASSLLTQTLVADGRYTPFAHQDRKSPLGLAVRRFVIHANGLNFPRVLSALEALGRWVDGKESGPGVAGKRELFFASSCRCADPFG